MATNGTPVHEERAPPDGQYAITLGQIFRRKLWIIVIATMIGGLCGYLFYVRQVPLHQAAARVWVDRQITNMPVDMMAVMNGMSPMDQLLQTHSELIRSQKILSEATKDPRLPKLGIFAGEQQGLAHAIFRGLGVARPKNKDNTYSPNILEITFRSTSAAESVIVLDAVVNQYVNFVRQSQESSGERTLDLIAKARNDLQKELDAEEKAYEEFRKGKDVIFRSSSRGDLVSVEQDALFDVERKLTAMAQQKIELKGKVDRLTALPKDDKSLKAAMEILIGRQSDMMLQGIPELGRRQSAELLSLQSRELELLERYADDHPAVISVRKKIELVKQQEQKELEESKARIAKQTPVQGSADLIGSYIRSLQIEHDIISQNERDLGIYLQDKRKLAKQHADLIALERQHIDRIARKKSLFDEVVKRLEQMNLARRDGGMKAEIISPAASMGEVGGAIFRAVLIGSFGGMLVGLLLAYLAELADQGFRGPEDIRLALGVNVLAHIPDIQTVKPSKGAKDDAVARLHKTLVAVHNPKSRSSEAFKNVRTALYFSVKGESHKIIQVTSPEPGDGKTTLSCNLAVSVAQSGRRTLLIDADLRKPRVHKLFGVANELGLSQLIADPSSDWRTAVERAPGIEHLDLIPSGGTANNASELLTNPRFEQLLQELSGHYDFVIVDTPPLLACTDPATVAPRVDGVLIAMKMHNNSRPQARRAIEILNQVNCNLLGVVVNGWNLQGRYGYGYSSKYGYRGYKYEDPSQFMNYGGYGGYNDYYGDDRRPKSKERDSARV
ncbi:MAG TPA: polysaccharide biosynthesis tyrosine autokinase [Planctomycetia bacterium]|nr:polysaccharide biosynthesis tyrosine autokinase [Planctomycetia bacterium]